MSSAASHVPKLLVIGSINMDLVVRSQRLPLAGETTTGHSLAEISGGKGANQAVAAARLGADVCMIGRVGSDGFGNSLRTQLAKDGISDSTILQTPGSSGVAIIGVEDSGQNCITVVPGANGLLTAADLHAHSAAFDNVDMLLLQLEVPLDTVLEAIRLAKDRNIPVLLDPAPAPADFPEQLLSVDYVCPNESEAQRLTGMAVDSIESASKAANKLRSMGAANAIVTLGHRGVVFCDGQGRTDHVPAFAINAVDTTAAGDSFAAAFAFHIAQHNNITAAVRFACAAGALAASRMGAQPGMPNYEDVMRLLG